MRQQTYQKTLSALLVVAALLYAVVGAAGTAGAARRPGGSGATTTRAAATGGTRPHAHAAIAHPARQAHPTRAVTRHGKVSTKRIVAHKKRTRARSVHPASHGLRNRAALRRTHRQKSMRRAKQARRRAAAPRSSQGAAAVVLRQGQGLPNSHNSTTSPAPAPVGPPALIPVSGAVSRGIHVNATTVFTFTGVITLSTDYIVTPGETLVVQPGTTVQFSGNHGLYVQGTLTALGSSNQPITFTSTAGTPASWGGIAFLAGSDASTLDHVHLSYAGGGLNTVTPSSGCCAYAGIYVNGAAPTISNSTIDFTGNGSHNNNGNGIEVGSSGPVLLDDALDNNSGWPIRYDQLPNDLSMTNNGLTATGDANGSIMDVAANATVAGAWNLSNIGLSLQLEGDVTIAPGAQVTVGMTNTLLFNGGGLYVQGTLTMSGTATSPISVTSPSGTPASWGGIAFLAGSDASTLDHVHLSYAGGGLNTVTPSSGCCAYAGIYVNGAAPTISNSTIDFTGNGSHNNNGNGIEVGSSGPVLLDDALDNNSGWPIRYDQLPNDLSMTNNGLTATGDANGSIMDVAANATVAGAWNLSNIGLSLQLEGDVTIAPGAQVTVGMTNTLLFNGGGLYVQGTLTMSGTATSPISVTSPSGTPASWGGIAFLAGSDASTLDHVHLSYAGGGLNTASPSSGCCAYTGIYVNGAAPTISESTIDSVGNGGNDIEVGNGGAPSLRFNTFGGVTGNGDGVKNDAPQSGVLVDALYNWWGDVSGPGGAGSGQGTPVSGGVAFLPWMTSAPS